MAVRQPTSQVATTRAMIQPKEDTLDRVFNALENFGCRADDDIRDRTLGAPVSMRCENDALGSVLEMVEKSFCPDSVNSEQGNGERPAQLQTQSPRERVEQRKDTALPKYENGIMDNVLEGVENAAFRYHDCAHNSKIVSNNKAIVVPYEWDILDSVFEGIERATRPDEYKEEPWRLERDIRARCSESTDGNLLDRVCKSMEYAVSQDIDAVSQDIDAVVLAIKPCMVDSVCESLEHTACCQDASRTGDPNDIIEHVIRFLNKDVEEAPKVAPLKLKPDVEAPGGDVEESREVAPDEEDEAPIAVEKAVGRTLEFLNKDILPTPASTKPTDPDVVPELAQSTWVRRKLAEWLPMSLQFHKLDLLFSTNHHGRTLERLYSRVSKAKHTILLLEPLTSGKPMVVGMYASENWHPSTKVYGDGSCFLFRAVEDDPDETQCWKWHPKDILEEDGGNEAALLEQFQVGTRTFISMGGNKGGSSGLRLNEDLTKAESSPACGFDNLPLAGEMFEVGLVEVYQMVRQMDGF
jgi:hypothetical protein